MKNKCVSVEELRSFAVQVSVSCDVKTPTHRCDEKVTQNTS